MERTGLWSRSSFTPISRIQIRELQSRPAHRWQSVEQSSLDSWFEKYPLYTRPEESISYYNKGQIVGVLLDIIIRDRTDNRAGMDDVFRALNEEYAKAGKFYQESDALRAVMEEVIRKKDPWRDCRACPIFLSAIFRGTDEIPYADYLALAGLDLRDTSQRRAALRFHRHAVTTRPARRLHPWIASSAASDAGLKEGDVLLQLNGEPFPRVPERWLREHQPERTRYTEDSAGRGKDGYFLPARAA